MGPSGVPPDPHGPDDDVGGRLVVVGGARAHQCWAWGPSRCCGSARMVSMCWWARCWGLPVGRSAPVGRTGVPEVLPAGIGDAGVYLFG